MHFLGNGKSQILNLPQLKSLSDCRNDILCQATTTLEDVAGPDVVALGHVSHEVQGVGVTSGRERNVGHLVDE